VGTGPFTLSRWQQDKRIELVRNPHYWRPGLPYVDAVDFEIEPLGNERIDKVLDGTMDVSAISAPWELRNLDGIMSSPAKAAKLTVERDSGDAEKSFVMFNTQRRPLDDVRVRQAIAYATDMKAIATISGWTADQRAVGPISPESPYFTPETYPEYNPDKARALLREYLADTSVRGRREISFTMITPDVGFEYVSTLVEQWRKVGIDAKVQLIDVKNAVRLAVFGQYDAMVLRYFAAPDPDVLWHFFVNSTIVDDGISLNFTRLRNDDISEGMNDARSTPDPAVRKKAYARVQEALAEQMPYLWMDRTEWRIISSSSVRNAHNVTLPGGQSAMPVFAGTFRLTETWIDH
jgi:peptide/nickel transport system substrate-binding protein